MTLTPQQVAQFREDGFLVLESIFGPAEVAEMRRAADDVLHLIVNSSLLHERRSGRLDWRQTSRGEQVVRKIQPVNDLSLTFSGLAADERLGGPLSQLMGEPAVLMEEKLNYKQPLPEPVSGVPIRQLDDWFPVHNDWAYYRAQDYPQDILSSAVAIDACTPDNGPIRVWPGSHREHLEHERIENGLQVKPGLVDFDGGQDVLLPAGSFVIFHALLIHNSRTNTSGRPRRLMIYSHYPQSANMGHDVRNGPSRLREAPYEHEYYRRRLRGEVQDRFEVPTYE